MNAGLTIKRTLRFLLPEAVRFSVFFPRYLYSLVARKTHLRVYDGPFKGMQYAEQSFASVLIPKLLGIYEKELAGVVAEIMATPFDTVIDIGAAEGYYAVGLARFHPKRPNIVAFEMSEVGRDTLHRIAQMNNVSDRITVLGECTVDLLAARIPNHSTLIVCDVEGAEETLLDPRRIPQLSKVSILVELHKRKAPGIESILKSRFEDSHSITEVHQSDRSESDFPFWGPLLPFCPKAYVLNCVNEFRQPWEDNMTWYWMKPRPST